MPNESGCVDGVHFTEHVDTIKSLKSALRNDEATTLLLKCVDATESESRIGGWGVAPWYYEQLAILYRKEKRIADEVSILERFEGQRKAPGALPPKLIDRLARARERLSRSQRPSMQ